jgi:hypothetical protein
MSPLIKATLTGTALQLAPAMIILFGTLSSAATGAVGGAVGYLISTRLLGGT